MGTFSGGLRSEENSNYLLIVNPFNLVCEPRKRQYVRLHLFGLVACEKKVATIKYISHCNTLLLDNGRHRPSRLATTPLRCLKYRRWLGCTQKKEQPFQEDFSFAQVQSQARTWTTWLVILHSCHDVNPLFYIFVLLNLFYTLGRHTYLNQSSSYKGPNKQTLATTSLMSVGNNLVANDGRRRMDAKKTSISVHWSTATELWLSSTCVVMLVLCDWRNFIFNGMDRLGFAKFQLWEPYSGNGWV